MNSITSLPMQSHTLLAWIQIELLSTDTSVGYLHEQHQVHRGGGERERECVCVRKMGKNTATE